MQQLDPESVEAKNVYVKYNLAFALNRRNEAASDRAAAQQICEEYVFVC